MTSCYTLKMIDFIAYYLGEKDKPDNWDDLYSEYISLRENKTSNYLLNLARDVIYLKAKYQIIQHAVKVLTYDKVPALIDILKSNGFRAEYNFENKSTYTRDLAAALSGSKKLITQWQRKEDELKTYIEKHNAKGFERKDFYMWAVALGEHRKDRVDLETIVVAEWCIMLNNFEKYVEITNAQQHNKLAKYGTAKD